MKSGSENALVRQLSICGQVAEHKSEKIREHGGDEERILAPLTQEERQTLAALLAKLQTHWMEDHAAHHREQGQ